MHPKIKHKSQESILRNPKYQVKTSNNDRARTINRLCTLVPSSGIGAMWLGGIATYTTTKDQCTEMVYCSSVTVARCFSLGTLGFGVCFLVIYAFSLDGWLSLFYGVSTFPYAFLY